MLTNQQIAWAKSHDWFIRDNGDGTILVRDQRRRHRQMKQARFWIDNNGGAVRLKLRDGQTVSHTFGGPTDEGYSWTAEEYSFDGRTVVCKWGTDARDCDGRMQRCGVARCAVDRLTQGYTDPESRITYPAWENGKQSQRDYSAEAMGY